MRVLCLLPSVQWRAEPGSHPGNWPHASEWPALPALSSLGCPHGLTSVHRAKFPHPGNAASAGHSFVKRWVVDQSVPKAEHRARSNTSTASHTRENRCTAPTLTSENSNVQRKENTPHKARVTHPRSHRALIRARILPAFPGHSYTHTHFMLVLSPGLQLNRLGTFSHKHNQLSTLH